MTDKIYKFKHILFGPGGAFGLCYLGFVKYCIQNKIIELDNIESFHGISIGSLLSVVLCLGYECDVLDDYFVKRPWNKAFDSNIHLLLNSIQSCGIYDKKFFITILEPLFNGKNISIDITMKQFVEITGTQIYIYATEALSFEPFVFSCKTTPDVTMIDAIYASCCIPGIFVPCRINDIMYFDGGLRILIPIDKCLEFTQEANTDSILAIQATSDQNITINTDNIFKFFFSLIRVIVSIIRSKQNNCIEYYYNFNADESRVLDFSQTINSQEFRAELFELGYSHAEEVFK